MIDPRLAILRDLIDVEMRPAPELEALLAQLGDDACERLAEPVNDPETRP